MKIKKQVKGKWNFLLMRPKGEVTNFALSPLIVAGALLFALVFTIGALVIANLYFSLYLDYQELAESRREILARLDQMGSQYKYQTSLVQDYAELLNELDMSEAEAGAGASGRPGPDTPAPEAPPEDTAWPSADLENPLEAWAALLPDLDLRPEDSLQIDDFKAEGHRFSFQLVNEAPGSLARGRLLTLFLLEAEGRRQAVPFPDFDPRSNQPDFELGPGYNIRSSKNISGQLKAPAGSKIVEAMVAAQSSDGRMVMKKRIKP